MGVVARGPWAAARRVETDAAHVEARAAVGREAKEACFHGLRDRFRGELATLCGDSSNNGSGGAAALADLGSWKLLPLPRHDKDAVLVVFDNDRGAGSAFLSELECKGVLQVPNSVAWESTEDSASPGGRPLADFLEEEALVSEQERRELEVPLEVLQKPYARGLSYTQPSDLQSFCFTGHYGQVLHKASGSLLFVPTKSKPGLDKANLIAVHGSIRFFSPKEILNLFGFPKNFVMPPAMELRHRYKAVGNSIAVTVTTKLLQILLLREDDSCLRSLQ